MEKEKLLRNAFSHAVSNAAIRFADEDIDFIIVKTDMEEFAKKHGVELTEEEIVDYIHEESARIHEALKDFTYSKKIMN